MKPIVVDISSVLGEPGGTLDVLRDVEIETLFNSGAEYSPAGPAHLDVTLMNAGNSIVALGSVTVNVRTECAKCAETFDLSLTGNVESLYVEEDQVSELEEEADWELLIGDSVDLAVATLSALQLALPLAALHAEDCAGICSQCGCNLNVSECDCQEDDIDVHPFAALKDLDLGEE